MPRKLETLGHLCAAEDFFAFFGITPDPLVLVRHRVAVLRAWAREVAEIDGGDPPADEGQRIALYRAALERVHDDFASGRGHLRLVGGAGGCVGCALRTRAR